MKKLVILISTLLLLILTGCAINETTETTNHKLINVNKRLNLNSKADYYRLFNKDIKHEIKIEITVSEFQKMLGDMKNYYNRYGTYKSDTFYQANFTYTDIYGTITVSDVGFRTRGNKSRVLPQNNDGSLNLSHYMIKFNETFSYDPNTEVYQDLAKRKVFDLDELNLKYNRNYDNTYISEIFSFDLFNKVGVNAPLSTLASFTLKIGNKETLLGVYSIIEPINKEFLDKRFKDNDNTGNLYKCLWQDNGPATLIKGYSSQAIGIKNSSINYRPSYDLKTNKEEANFQNLKTFINSINNLTGDYFENYIEENFEVDKFIKLLALGVLIGNPDDYRGLGNNYYLYHNNKTNKFEMFPYDYDHSLGQGWSGDPAFTNYSIGANIYDWPNNNLIWNQPYGNGSHPLADKILRIKKYQLQYEYYLQEFINPSNKIFTHSAFREQYLSYKSLYDLDARNSYQHFGFGERNSRWYFEEKVKDINNQLNYYLSNPSRRGTR